MFPTNPNSAGEACRPNQSASADSPFATSLSWWEGGQSKNSAGFSRLVKSLDIPMAEAASPSRLKPAHKEFFVPLPTS